MKAKRREDDEEKTVWIYVGFGYDGMMRVLQSQEIQINSCRRRCIQDGSEYSGFFFDDVG